MNKREGSVWEQRGELAIMQGLRGQQRMWLLFHVMVDL